MAVALAVLGILSMLGAALIVDATIRRSAAENARLMKRLVRSQRRMDKAMEKLGEYAEMLHNYVEFLESQEPESDDENEDTDGDEPEPEDRPWKPGEATRLHNEIRDLVEPEEGVAAHDDE